MGKILLVDDEASIRSAIRDILEYEEYEVCEAGSGEQALKVAQEEEVVLALVDVKMPGMNGVETLEHLKKAHRFPVIMISATQPSIWWWMPSEKGLMTSYPSR